MMDTYIKILTEDGQAAAVEKLPDPVYVMAQKGNGRIVRCMEQQAQGILDATEQKIYQLEGATDIGRAVAVAVLITPAEYDELVEILGAPPAPPEPETPGPDEPSPEQNKTLEQKVATLERKVDQLQRQAVGL